MRPIKLELNYIGPYQEEIIDFQNINQTLFLISGRTGSGKSMIFDAITHALFATASTSARGSESLRSQFAPSTEPSIIRFTFSYGKSNYIVERRLRYFRDTNTTETPPESSIYNEMGELIESGLTKVTSFITDLLQLDAIQFRQIGLLPQGEFRKFLVASSSDKEQILKALFGTERFNALYQKLKTKYDEEKKSLNLSYEIIMNRFKHEINEEMISPSFTENIKILEQKKNTLTNYLQDKKEEQSELKRTLDILSKEISNLETNNQLIEEYEQEKDKLTEILKEQPVIQEKEETLVIFDKVHSIKDDYLNAEKNKKLFFSTKAEVSKLEENLREIERNLENTKQTLEILLKDEARIDDFRVKVRTLSKFDTKEYQAIERDIEILEKEIKEKQQDIETFKKEITSLEKKLSQIYVNEDDLITLRETIFESREVLDDLSREKEKADENEKHFLNLQKAKEEIAHLSRQELELQKAIDAQNTDLKSIQGLNVQNINELISHLEVGQPCVVCQQIVAELPKKIVYDVELYQTLESVQEAKQKATTRNEILNDYKIKETRALSVIKKEVDEATNKLEYRKQQEKDIAHTLTKKRELEQQIAKETIDLQVMMNQLEILTHDYSQYVKRFENFKGDTGYPDFHSFKVAYTDMDISISSFDKDKEMLINQKSEETIALTKMTAEKDSAIFKRETYKESWNNSQKTLDTFIENNKEIEVEKIDDILRMNTKSLKTEINAYYESVRDTGSIIKNTKARIINFEKVDLQEKQNKHKLMTERIDSLHKEMGQMEHQVKVLQETVESLAKQIKDYHIKEEAFTKLAKFVELLNGKNGNPTLSRFVLVYYLELILSHANIRLRKMTHGRYELRRVDSYRSDQSLHIDVFDYFNNARRSVATLSGGESFQAALALALALSEIIQHEAGSIDMNMLLIDEGFGTLDEETLKVAIDTLFDLQKTGKMIGIISHVEELKTLIGNVLYVETEDERSKTRLVTPLSN